MKCFIGFLVLAIGACQMISGSPVRSGGMVFYQPDYYSPHRAFVMQYASQPVKSYRRQGQAAGVSAFVSGKKISTGTLIRQEETEDPHGAHSVAEAYPGSDEKHSDEIPETQFDEEQPPNTYIPPEVAHDEIPDDEIPETAVVPNNNRNTPTLSDEIDEDDEDVQITKKSKNRPSPSSYFPVSFGSTNGGAIAIANSYSTGKGGTASSHATAYGSGSKSKSKRRNEQ